VYLSGLQPAVVRALVPCGVRPPQSDHRKHMSPQPPNIPPPPPVPVVAAR
jgi:hypothetical protein